MTLYNMLLADRDGKMWDYPSLAMAAGSGSSLVVPAQGEMCPLPEGATLVMVPYGLPAGVDSKGRFRVVKYNPYQGVSRRRVYPVAALLPQGFTRLLVPGLVGAGRTAPLLGYAAVGVKDGRIYTAAVRTDEHYRWHPRYFNTDALDEKVNGLKKAFAGNRIVAQLSRCALQYGCFTAQNLFYGRWEAGIPVSPSCNARCLGCISLQESECCPSPQQRIDFVPSVEEIVELAVHHLTRQEGEMVSFGQGCEGEPSLQEQVIAKAIGLIRRRTQRGTININTNAGFYEGIQNICDSGLDSMRVSLISALPEHYQSYYRPCNYSLDQVARSLRYAAGRGVYTSLNLLVYPGYSDTKEQLEALISFARSTGIKMMQLRNLNIAADALKMAMPASGRRQGMLSMINILAEQLPDVRIASYSHPVK